VLPDKNFNDRGGGLGRAGRGAIPADLRYLAKATRVSASGTLPRHGCADTEEVTGSNPVSPTVVADRCPDTPELTSTWRCGMVVLVMLEDLVRLRWARDTMDRDYAQPLDVPALARVALMSPGHFSRSFRAAFGETPYSYLMTRRIERAKALLRRGDLTVTEVCFAVGCTSLGSFSSRFTELVGESPSSYRARCHDEGAAIPPCVVKIYTRPVRNGEAKAASGP